MKGWECQPVIPVAGCRNAGPTSQTLAQHWDNLWPKVIRHERRIVSAEIILMHLVSVRTWQTRHILVQLGLHQGSYFQNSRLLRYMYVRTCLMSWATLRFLENQWGLWQHMYYALTGRGPLNQAVEQDEVFKYLRIWGAPKIHGSPIYVIDNLASKLPPWSIMTIT